MYLSRKYCSRPKSIGDVKCGLNNKCDKSFSFYKIKSSKNIYN